MNTNAYYEIGSSHRVCEDYAISGLHEGMAYAIVSDGCSSSEDSDVGARILSHIAKGVLIYLKERNLILSGAFPDIFKELILRKCLEVKTSLGLPTNVFDATLIISVVMDGKAVCIGWGDGYLAIVDKNKMITFFEIKFTSGAPYYLSYEMSQGKKEAYQKEFGEGAIHFSNCNIDLSGIISNFSTKSCPIQDKPTLNRVGNITDISFITLSSDGIDTYQDDPRFSDIDGKEKKTYKASEMISSLVSYKSTAGEFVTRRMQRNKEDLNKKHILHFDDISCATIALD
jgi:hypothetical protein